ncbi:unnamed protein product [Vitrella brassicaformis CCMP3155]|uniref:Uncharacterized protein n=1 Tax=Vitrella brassicaformis (strain CCMP3155) TaxID=1169540 RepID=A0A0G4FT75_VITBC|nr:unnamed protein product [Vitrella brassicaformis CCMP3155]|eukprot:CEM17829.1 unnamed protein product [Vitrella brassicaformis CCMP3155]
MGGRGHLPSASRSPYQESSKSSIHPATGSIPARGQGTSYLRGLVIGDVKNEVNFGGRHWVTDRGPRMSAGGARWVADAIQLMGWRTSCRRVGGDFVPLLIYDTTSLSPSQSVNIFYKQGGPPHRHPTTAEQGRGRALQRRSVGCAHRIRE